MSAESNGWRFRGRDMCLVNRTSSVGFWLVVSSLVSIRHTCCLSLSGNFCSRWRCNQISRGNRIKQFFESNNREQRRMETVSCVLKWYFEMKRHLDETNRLLLKACTQLVDTHLDDVFPLMMTIWSIGVHCVDYFRPVKWQQETIANIKWKTNWVSGWN